MPDFVTQYQGLALDLLRGAGIALGVTLAAEIIGTVLGLFVALCRLYGNALVRAAALVYVDAIRGTPMLVQILLLYFGVPGLVSSITGEPFNVPVLVAGIAALGLNSGAYVSEVYRSAISSIDKGQHEAARALGLSRVQTMRFIVLPQAFRFAIPPLGNEFITLLKDTSLLSVIGVMEITMRGQLYMSRTYEAFTAFTGVAITYLAMTVTISLLLRRLERKLRIP